MLDGYIRVSQVAGRSGDNFISPSVQRDQIESWAQAHGVLIGEIFEELDESGARQDRPLFLHAIERVEAGRSGGIIVAKLDRFGRSLPAGLAAIERIQGANGTFISVQDGLDLGTDTGKLVLRIMLSMAEWELDRIRTNWDIAKARAISRGVHVGSTIPFGYRRLSSGRIRIDPSTASFVTHIFEARAEGATIAALCHWLEEKGAVTSRGNSGWTDSTVRRILANRVYLGELRSGSHVARGTHQPLVTREVWQQAQRPRVLGSQQAKTPTLLGGLLRCAGCQMALNSQTLTTRTGRRIAYYACQGRSSQGPCTSPARVSGPVIEPFIEEAFFGEVRAREQRPSGSGKKLNGLRQEADDAEAALALYRDNPRLLTVLGEDRYVQGLKVRARAAELAVSAVAREERRAADIQLPTTRELEDRWPSMRVEQRRQSISDLVDCVFVIRGWGRVAERTFVYFRGQQPLDLPVQGGRRHASTPFDPRQPGQVGKVRRPQRWTIERITVRLKAFLAERESWPAPEEFFVSGNGPLYAQVVRAGGPEHWARRMSVRPPIAKQGIRAWNSELAADTLRRFMRGRVSRPTRREFAEQGFRGLYNWLQKNGGVEQWLTKI